MVSYSYIEGEMYLRRIATGFIFWDIEISKSTSCYLSLGMIAPW